MSVGIIGGNVRALHAISAVLSPVAVLANTTTEQTFTVPGLVLNQIVTVNKPTAQAGLGIVGARVSGANTLAITFSNNTGSSITPTASETYALGIMSPESGVLGTKIGF